MIRFTQTDKWEDKWFRKLTVGQKLIFLYICDKCNLAGFLEFDEDMVSFQIGVEVVKIEGALEGLARGIVRKGDYIWIKNFLKHQKNSPINPVNPAHKNIIRCINERKEFHKEIEQIYGALKPLFRGIGIGKGISKGKGSSKKYKESKELSDNADTIYQIYPKHVNKTTAIESIKKALQKISFNDLAEKVKDYTDAVEGCDRQYIPYPSTWFNNDKWTDDPEEWKTVGRETTQPPEPEKIDLEANLKRVREGKK